MEQQSRWVLIAVMAIVAIGGLTVIQQSDDAKGWTTGIAMFVIAIGFIFYEINETMTAQSGHGGHGGHASHRH